MSDAKTEELSETCDTESVQPEASLKRYYLLEDDDDHNYIFVTPTELDLYFDLEKQDGISSLVAVVNLDKNHNCSKIGRDGPYPRCTCERFDSWICNRSFRHAKGTLPFCPGAFDKPIVLVGILPFAWGRA